MFSAFCSCIYTVAVNQPLVPTSLAKWDKIKIEKEQKVDEHDHDDHDDDDDDKLIKRILTRIELPFARNE